MYRKAVVAKVLRAPLRLSGLAQQLLHPAMEPISIKIAFNPKPTQDGPHPRRPPRGPSPR